MKIEKEGSAQAGLSRPRDGISTALVTTLAAVFAIFAWTTPNHYPPWLSFHGEFAMAVAACIAGAWVLWHGRRGPSFMPAATLLSLVLALLPWAQLTSGSIDFTGDAWIASLYLVGFGLANLIGYRAGATWGMAYVVEALESVILFAALVSVWIALYQWQRLDYLGILAIDISKGMRPYANLVQPNHLATLLVLGLVATAFLFETRRLGRAPSLLVVSLLGFGLAMTQSRTGILEVAVIGILLVARPRGTSDRILSSHVVLSVSVVLAMPFLWEFVRESSPLATGRGTAELASAGVRSIHWASMLDAIGRKPWLGYGWNQVGAAQFAVAPDHPPSGETLAQSHNLFLDLSVWNGIPIGLGLTAALAWWFWTAWRHADSSTTFLGLASIVAVFVHAMVEYPLYYTYFLLPVGVLMGVVSALTMPRAGIEVSKFLPPALLLLAAGATVATGLEYLRLEEAVRQLRFQQAHVSVHGPGKNPGEVLFLTQLGEFLSFARTPEHEGMTEDELEQMAAVVRRFPSKENTVRYAAALAINGHPSEANEALRRICRINPQDSCDAMKALWHALGEQKPAIAKITWPAD